MGNPIWFIFWLLVLIFISFWVAFIAAWFYIFVYVLVVCCSGLSGLTDMLLQIVQFPHYCAQAMMDCQSPF
ncbi:uncharacterized protein LOC119683769 [Teleopsis dalmanni]|uniref:uncharacterized protein LOC119673797 n=1 Tax=Teleopsis dalmanni TaxID=139649 RepID=UPI0018CFB87E|nr:uncharacterized protein LOC119673797 [Teleopsis dalmanni]XP_037953556.1 uncharacterized protein LOC119683769 [Teleopsis dalmanni]